MGRERRDETLCEKSGPFENTAILSRGARPWSSSGIDGWERTKIRFEPSSACITYPRKCSFLLEINFADVKGGTPICRQHAPRFSLPPPSFSLTGGGRGSEKAESTLGSSLDITSSFLFLWLSRETLKIPSYNRPAGGMLSWKLHSHD